MIYLPQIVKASTPWKKGKLICQKSPLKLREIWAIRIRLFLKKETRELVLPRFRGQVDKRKYQLISSEVPLADYPLSC